MVEIDAESAAAVVVDMQNDFCHPDGALYSPASEEAIQRVNDVVAEARDAGAEVVYTRDVHPPTQFDDAHYYDEFERWGEHVVEGSWGAEVHEDVDVRDGDKEVVKHTYDAFQGTGLEAWFDAHGVTDLVFCGTLANVCVLHTAASAGLRDFRPVIVEDAVGYITEDHREYALEHADWLFGEVIRLDDLEVV
ncbi:MAG: cysteine hydrolase family protein [Halobacteriales archaeon]